MHDCLNDQPARTVCKVAQSEIYACLADARARAARLIQPARRAPLNAGIKSFPTRDRRPSETEIQIAQKSPNMHSQKMGAGPCTTYLLAEYHNVDIMRAKGLNKDGWMWLRGLAAPE